MIEALLFVAGMVFAAPFIVWPVEPHFGSYGVWAMYRKPGQGVPRQQIQANFGCSKLFLFHVPRILNALPFGPSLVTRVRLVQAGCFSATACVLYWTSTRAFGFGAGASAAAGLLLLFVCTRPQLEFWAVNVESYYMLLVSICVAALCTLDPASSAVLPVLGVCTFILVFSGLSAKFVFLADPAFLCGGYLLAYGFSWERVLVIAAGGVSAVLLFVLMFHRHMERRAVAYVSTYSKWAASFLSLGVMRYAASSYLAPAGFLPLGLLAVAGGLSSLGEPRVWIVVGWGLSSALAVASQVRLCCYHFQIMLAPLGLAAFLAMGRLGDVAPWLPWVVLAGACVLAPRAARDFLAYYRAGPVVEHLRRAFGHLYVYYMDLRHAEVENLRKSHEGVFLAWGASLEVYAVARQKPPFNAPVSVYHQHMHYRWRGYLLEALKREEVRWVFDMTKHAGGKERFNPLACFLATGTVFVPRERVGTITAYERQNPYGSMADESWDFFVNRTPVADVVESLIQRIGQDPGKASWPWNMDVLAALGETFHDHQPAQWDGEESLLAVDGGQPLALLYGALAAWSREETGKARERLREWRRRSAPWVAMSPALQLADWELGRRLDEPTGALPLDAAGLNRLPLADALHICGFLAALAFAPGGRALAWAADLPKELAIPQSDYADQASVAELTRFSESMARRVSLGSVTWGARVLVLLFGPAALLAKLANALAPASDLTVVASSAASFTPDLEARISKRLSVAPGSFRYDTYEGTPTRDALLEMEFDCCILVTHDTGWANYGDLTRMALEVTAGAHYAYTYKSSRLAVLERMN